MLMEIFQNNPAEVYDIKRIFRDLKLDTLLPCQVALYGLVGRFGDG